MKKLLYLLCVACISCFVACSDDDPAPDPSGEVTYTLSANKTAVAVGEAVTFTVVTNRGEDITKSCSLCSNESCYAMGMSKITFDTAGSFVITAHYINGDPEIPGGILVPNTVTITVK
ncbi:MAG: hypothetical protein RSB29_03675 [Alistipes sp.]